MRNGKRVRCTLEFKQEAVRLVEIDSNRFFFGIWPTEFLLPPSERLGS
jgi:hypothetical protein